MTLLSVIIPNFNSGHLLQKSLNSLISISSVIDLEVVIIDNVSSDNPFEIVKDFSSLSVTFIVEKDNGVYDAMNKGINLSQGKWLFFLGAGDELNLDYLSLHWFDGTFDFFYGKAFDMEKQIEVGKVTTLYDLFRYGICHQTIFYKRYLFDKVNFNLRFPIQADLVFNIFLFSSTNYKGKFVNSIFCHYLGKGLSSKNKDEEFQRRKYLILINNLFLNPSFSNLKNTIKFLMYKVISWF